MITLSRFPSVRLGLLLAAALAAGIVTPVSARPDEPCPGEDDETKAIAAARPVELGAVRWHRDFEAAKGEARKRDVPMLVLFQEVPG